MSVNDDKKLRSVTSSDDEHTADSDVVLVQKPSWNPVVTSIILWTVFVFFMLVNIGISLLPAIFFMNPATAPFDPTPTNTSNHTIIPPPLHFPCNEPLKKNPSSGMCEVPCTWNQLTPAQNTAKEFVDNISLAISLLGFVFVLITWISLKQLRVFPNVIPLYIQGTSSCISLLIVIGNGLTAKEAFCSHKFGLEAAMKHPTSFCVAQAVLIQYLSNVCALWFIVYSICLVQMIFSKNVIDPRQSTRKQHIISAACCFLFPWILVGVVFKKSGYGKVLWGRICLPLDDDLTYYTNTMITEICLGVSCSCLLVVVFKLYRLRNVDVVQAEQSKKRRNRLDKIAVRLVCLMFAYAICSSLVYIPICVASRDKMRLTYYSRKYIGCLMFFPAEFCEQSRADFEHHTNANVFIVSYLSSGLFAISTVCFLAFNRQSRRLWRFWWQRIVDCCCVPSEEEQEP